MAPNMNDGPDTAQGQDLAGGPVAARDVTRLLRPLSGGDERAAERLTELVYAQVRAIAGKHLRQFGNQLTLQPTELAHELFLRLIGTETNWQDRRHFYGVVSVAMRRILVDTARARASDKRGGGELHVTLSADHRVLNGIEAGHFMEDLKHLLEKPVVLVMARE